MNINLKITYANSQNDNFVVERGKKYSYVVEQEVGGNRYWRIGAKSMDSPEIPGISYSSLPALLEVINTTIDEDEKKSRKAKALANRA
jgi:hypothetical protein